MLLLACAFLLPGVIVDKLATLVTWPARFVAIQLADFTADKAGASQGAPTLALGLVAAGLVGAVGYLIDLPGAVQVGELCAAWLCAITGLAVWRKRATQVRFPLIATTVAAALMWTAIANSGVRWDFYRYLGGDLRRRAQPEAALRAYEKGERYAPPGQSRQDKIDELKRQLGR
jgi:hypothetical protein